jgi:ABC-2 type transport system permease protein
MMVFFFGFMYVYMNLNNYIGKVILNGQEIANSWQNGFPPIYWLGSACADGNIVSFLLFAAFCIVPFVIAYLLLSANFIRIATTKKSVAKIKYVKKDVKAQSARKAMIIKEIKRFFTLPIYFFNCGFGAIMLIAAAVFVVIKGSSLAPMLYEAFQTEDISGLVCAIVCLAIGFCNMTIAPASSAVSLEGKNINLLKSLPMAAKDIFFAKAMPNLVVGLIPSFLCSAVAAIFMPMTPLEIVAVFVFPFAFQSFIAFAGLFANIKLPRFDWTNETVVVKQSGAMMIITFGGMATLGLIAMVYGFALRPVMSVSVYALVVSGVLLALCAAIESIIAKNAEKYMIDFNY